MGFCREAEVLPTGRVLLSTMGRGRIRPLLVANTQAEQRHLVLLSDVTWKWSMHPKPAVRLAFANLWSGMIESLLEDGARRDGLDLDFLPDPLEDGATLVQSDGVADPTLDLAMKIDAAVKTARPDGWRGVRAREQVIKAALYDLLHDEPEVERLFLIIKAQGEY